MANKVLHAMLPLSVAEHYVVHWLHRYLEGHLETAAQVPSHREQALTSAK